ncbi:MAG: hypothetical protein RIE74_02085, partial [Pseudomonadales bacterium]
EALLETDTPKPIRLTPGTKEHLIHNALLHGSLNRFEAERIGDHALNSTISILRAKGYPIVSQAEKVATRFGRKVRVLRYSIPKSELAVVDGRCNT